MKICSVLEQVSSHLSRNCNKTVCVYIYIHIVIFLVYIVICYIFIFFFNRMHHHRHNKFLVCAKSLAVKLILTLTLKTYFRGRSGPVAGGTDSSWHRCSLAAPRRGCWEGLLLPSCCSSAAPLEALQQRSGDPLKFCSGARMLRTLLLFPDPRPCTRAHL